MPASISHFLPSLNFTAKDCLIIFRSTDYFVTIISAVTCPRYHSSGRVEEIKGRNEEIENRKLISDTSILYYDFS